MSKHPRKQPDLQVGPLPHEVINRTIGTELDGGEVILSGAAQVHAARRHPTEYPVCLPHIGAVVLNPLYIGDDHRNPGKIELIGRIAAEGRPFLLIAINLATDAQGRYHITSFYPVSDQKVQDRRDRGFLKIARKQ